MKIIKLNKEDDLNILKTQYDKIIIQFSADWCGPCKKITPVMLEYFKNAKSTNGSCCYVYCDIDNLQSLARSFNITQVPSFSVITNQNENDEITLKISQIGGGSNLENNLSFFKENGVSLKICRT